MSEARHTAAEHSIITTYRKPIWRNFISAIKTYQLISAGDRIAVCMSGGKDSLLLAACLRALQRHSEVPLSFATRRWIPAIRLKTAPRWRRTRAGWASPSRYLKAISSPS